MRWLSKQRISHLLCVRAQVTAIWISCTLCLCFIRILYLRKKRNGRTTFTFIAMSVVLIVAMRARASIRFFFVDVSFSSSIWVLLLCSSTKEINSIRIHSTHSQIIASARERRNWNGQAERKINHMIYYCVKSHLMIETILKEEKIKWNVLEWNERGGKKFENLLIRNEKSRKRRKKKRRQDHRKIWETWLIIIFFLFVVAVAAAVAVVWIAFRLSLRWNVFVSGVSLFCVPFLDVFKFTVFSFLLWFSYYFLCVYLFLILFSSSSRS